MNEIQLDSFPSDPKTRRESDKPLSYLIKRYRGSSGGDTIKRILAAHPDGIARIEVIRIATRVGHWDYDGRLRALSEYLATFCLNDRLANYRLTHERMIRTRDMTKWHEKTTEYDGEGYVEDEEGIIKFYEKERDPAK